MNELQLWSGGGRCQFTPEKLVILPRWTESRKKSTTEENSKLPDFQNETAQFQNVLPWISRVFVISFLNIARVT